jgi:spore germination cell wall hydrolase CwlJ-like protein
MGTRAAAQEAAGVVAPAPGEDRARAVQCLATAIAYEAGFEPDAGQQAVAEVILNRVRTPLFPKSVCGVVFAGSERRTGCQFSFTCDGSLRRRMSAAVLARAQGVAEAAIDGRNPQRTGGAAWYHADYVYPYWAPSLVRVVKIGAHIFYRAPGAVDRPGGNGFTPGSEPVIAALKGVPLGPGMTAAPPAAVVAKPGASQPFTLWGLTPVR